MPETHEDQELTSTGELELTAIRAYFVVLILVLVLRPLLYLPIAETTPFVRSIALLTAVITLPAALRTTSGDETVIDYAVTGVFGAMAGVGALLLPTAASHFFGGWGDAVCTFVAVVLPLLTLLARYEERTFGFQLDVTEGLIVSVLTALQILPMLALLTML